VGLQALSRGCPSLINIELSKCNRITNEGLEAFPKSVQIWK